MLSGAGEEIGAIGDIENAIRALLNAFIPSFFHLLIAFCGETGGKGFYVLASQNIKLFKKFRGFVVGEMVLQELIRTWDDCDMQGSLLNQRFEASSKAMKFRSPLISVVQKNKARC